jgi:ATP-dependent DNA helicase PIF1
VLGIAACSLGGVTIHSFASIGIGTEPVKVLVQWVTNNPKAVGRWISVKALVIDEGMEKQTIPICFANKN